MSSAVKKTNAMRLLDAAGVAYSVRTYDFDETDLSGTHAADVLGLPPETVFKTLVTRGDKTGFVVFCIPAAEELDLKKAAKTSGNKAVEMLHVKELLPIAVFSALLILLLLLSPANLGWTSIAFLFFAIYAGFMLFVCGIGWGIWALTC